MVLSGPYVDTSDPKKPTYKEKGLTDSIYYAVLIVKPDSKFPGLVLLKNGNDLEGKFLKRYQENSIKQKIRMTNPSFSFGKK